MDLTISQKNITGEAALAAVTAAIEAGHKAGCRMNVAVVDAGGNLMAFLRDPGAFLHSITIAMDKAYTAAGFGMPTERLAALIEGNPMLRDGIIRRDRLVVFAGGLPIIIDGQVVGGIGVSGGSEHQDVDCAKAGLAALGLTC